MVLIQFPGTVFPLSPASLPTSMSCRCATSAEPIYPSTRLKASLKRNICSSLACFSPSSCPCGSTTAWCCGSCATRGCWRPFAFASRDTAANTPSRWGKSFLVFPHLLASLSQLSECCYLVGFLKSNELIARCCLLRCWFLASCSRPKGRL